MATEEVARQELSAAQEQAAIGTTTSVSASTVPADDLAVVQAAAQTARDRAATADLASQEARDTTVVLELQVTTLGGVGPPQPSPLPPAAPSVRHLVIIDDPMEDSTIANLHTQAANVHSTLYSWA